MTNRRALTLTLTLAAGLAALLAQPAAAQLQERTLRVGANQLPPDLGNPYKQVGSPASYSFSAIFDSLTFVGSPQGAEPSLATSWENTGPTTWRFKLRPDIVFANGEKFDAAAVVAVVDWLLSEEGKKFGNRAAFEMANMAGAKAIDPVTVEFTTTGPAPIFPSQLDVMSIVPPKAWKETGLTDFVKAPFATGPFKATEFKADLVKLVANETSFRKPKIRNVEVYAMPERPARVQGFLSGQLQVVTQVSPDDFPKIEQAGGRIDRARSPQNLSVAFVIDNLQPGATDNTALKDKRVRQALNYAVDRDTIVKSLLSSVGATASNSVVPELAVGHHPGLKPYPFDPGRAKTLLAEAGYAGGFDLKIEFVCGGQPADCDIYQQVAQDLGKVNVRVTLANLAFPDYLQKLLNTKWQGNAFVSVNDSLPTLDAMNAFKKNTCLWPTPFYCAETHKALVEQINVEMNADKRIALLHKLAEIYYEEAPHIFLTEIVDLIAVHNSVKGFRNLARNFTYEDLEFTR